VTSLIDPSKPTQTTATTQSVRDNFRAARDEIVALQSIKADAASLSAHLANLSNPHAVTAAQVGAATTASLSSTDATVSAHLANLSNPHAVTAAQVGAATTAALASTDANVSSLQSAISALPKCAIYNSAVQTIANSTDVALNFDSELFDTHSLHSVSTNNTRAIIPAGVAGYYLVIGTIRWSSNTAGRRVTRLTLNGVSAQVQTVYQPTASLACVTQVVSLLLLQWQDYIELVAYQDSGSSIDSGGTVLANYNTLSLVRLL